MLAACDSLTPGCLSSCLLGHSVSVCGHMCPSLCALLGFLRGVWPGACMYVHLSSPHGQCGDMRGGVSESGCLLCLSLCLSECLVPTEPIGLSDSRNQDSSHCCVTCCVKHFRDISAGSLFTDAAARALRGEVTCPANSGRAVI